MSSLDRLPRGARVEILNQLLSSIAEEMGATLMRAALSPNIKERRDYSCAIFDGCGRMIAQAAHIPVHLGSQPASVEAAIAAGIEVPEGGHIIVNDPYAGGTHLPDITLVTPVYAPGGRAGADASAKRVWFWVANRAHHADVGGISPGSLPIADHIDDEGFRTAPSLLDEEVRARLLAETRTPAEREGDLRAQTAANRLGARRLLELCERFEPSELGESPLARYVAELFDHSEKVVRAMIAEIPDGEWTARDVLDDDGFGTRDIGIECRLSVSGDELCCDFRGSDGQVRGPVNAVRAITQSACYYAVRCLAPGDLPTNDGCFRPVEVKVRGGSVVAAEYPAPVAVGNVETSQRIVDVVFAALAQALPGRIPAASCGSMNNVVVGSRGAATAYTYYETLAGGSGGGPSGAGADAIHTHMTNTLNTPVEAFEQAYPVRIAHYRVRGDDSALADSTSRHVGGRGVERAYAFLTASEVTLQTERRDHRPPGREGGGAGVQGENLLLRAGASTPERLGAKCRVEVEAGDVVIVRTPGGGGWGSP